MSLKGGFTVRPQFVDFKFLISYSSCTQCGWVGVWCITIMYLSIAVRLNPDRSIMFIARLMTLTTHSFNLINAHKYNGDEL